MFLPRDALFTYKRYGIRYKHVCLSLCAVCPTAWAQNFAPYPFMAGFYRAAFVRLDRLLVNVTTGL